MLARIDSTHLLVKGKWADGRPKQLVAGMTR
nr:MAG TPA: Protein of unknown function (DUF1315) [Caudoviricetes sp.]